MSIPPPNISEFAQCLMNDIQAAQVGVKDLQFHKDDPATAVGHQILQACEIFNSEIKKQDFKTLDQKQITDITSFSTDCLQKIRSSIDNNELQLGPKIQIFLQTAERLEKLLNSFQKILSHHDAMDTFEKLIFDKEPWAEIEFISLIGSKNPWAEEKLIQYAAQRNPFAMQVLLHEVKNPKCIIACKDVPGFCEEIAHLFDRNNRIDLQMDGVHLLQVLVGQVSEEWVQNFLKEVMVKPLDSQVTNKIMEVLHAPLLKGWLQSELVKGSCLQEAWALNCLYYLLEYCQLKQSDHHSFQQIQEITDLLIKQSEGNIRLQQRLLCWAALLSAEDKFRVRLNKAISLGELCNKYYPTPGFVTNCLDRLDRFKSKLEKSNLKFTPASFLLRYYFFLMVLQREERLIDVLSGDYNPKDYQSPAVSDCFSEVKQIMLGSFLDSDSDLFKPEMAELVNGLADEGVQFLCPKISLDRIGNTPLNVKYLVGETSVAKWVRDNCVAHSSGMRLPPLIDSKEKISPILFAERNARLKVAYGDEVVDSRCFPALGMVDLHGGQFNILSYFLGEDCPLDPFHSLRFTYNEGGNCLVGKKGGNPYAIIGNDAAALNLHFLKKEIAALGFRKVSDKRWERGESYPAEKCDLNEKDLRLLFGLDLGIPPEDIYLVENPQYHLDVAMTILDEKTVVVNDSVQALEVWEKYAEQKMATSGFLYNEARYRERLQNLRKRAKAFKQHEDLTAKQLKAQRFTVIRIGGVFEDLFEDVPKNHRINSFNCVTFTSPVGHRNMIAMNCDPFFKAHYEEVLETHMPKKCRIHYLDLNESRNLLALGGGVHCMMRPLAKST